MKKFLICLLTSSQTLCFCDDTKSKQIEIQKFQKAKKFLLSKNDLVLPKDKAKKAAIQIENEKKDKVKKAAIRIENEKKDWLHEYLRKQDYRIAKDLSVRPTKKRRDNEVKDEKS